MKTKLTLFCLFFLFIGSSYAQVTIGITEEPVEGAILQLKNIASVTDGAPNATKGLGLPRIHLLKVDDLDGILPPAKMFGSYKSDHIGLMVYNITEACSFDFVFEQGIHVWDGDKWNSLRTKSNNANETSTATTVTDRDGNIYPIASFGAAGTWMTQSLRTKTAPGGAPLVNSLNFEYKDNYYVKCYVYPGPGKVDGINILDGTDPTMFNKHPEYGLFYNWYAATNNKNCRSLNNVNQGQASGALGANEVESIYTSHIQGICPKGWHLPSDREFNALEKELTQNATAYSTESSNGTWSSAWETTTGSRGVNQGRAMKSPIQVENPDNAHATGGTSKPAENNGFNFYLTGGADPYFASLYKDAYGKYSHIWTSSSVSKHSAWIRRMIDTWYSSTTNTKIERNTGIMDMLFQVRCKKD